MASAFGAATSFITAAILAAMDIHWDFSFYSYMAFFIIPIGAIFSGFIAASGYYFGAWIANARPTKLILLNMVIVSITTFFLIYYLEYYFMVIDGKAVRDVIAFLDFLKIEVVHTTLQFRMRATKIGSPIELGSLGYLFALLQIIGFGVGGFAVYGFLSSKPYCEACSKYLVARDSQIRYTNDPERLTGT